MHEKYLWTSSAGVAGFSFGTVDALEDVLPERGEPLTEAEREPLADPGDMESICAQLGALRNPDPEAILNNWAA